MVIKVSFSWLNQAVDFYHNLNMMGLIIFYSILLTLILLIVLVGMMEKNKQEERKKQLQKELTLPNQGIKDMVSEILPESIINKSEELPVAVDEIDDNINLTSFETEQEEKSIISYEELIKTFKDKHNQSERQANVVDKGVEESKRYPKKFYNSPHISPIHGYERGNYLEKVSSPVNEDNNNQPLTDSNREFLTALKELKNNLD